MELRALISLASMLPVTIRRQNYIRSYLITRIEFFRMFLFHGLILKEVGRQAPEGEDWRVSLYIALENVL